LNTTHNTSVPRDKLIKFIRAIPERFSGTQLDSNNIAKTMRHRLVRSWFKLNYHNFLIKREGKTGEDGITWDGHSQHTLAYQTPFKGRRGRPLAGGRAPGGNDGRMTEKQLQEWIGYFTRTLDFLIQNYDLTTAKSISAGSAWNKMKEKYGDDIAKLHHRDFGLRKIGEYYIGDKSGNLLDSYRPDFYDGSEQNGYEYITSTPQQKFRDHDTEPVAGSLVPYAQEFANKRPITPDNLNVPSKKMLVEGIVKSIPYAATVAAEGNY
tara:strand:- start:749 stop:1543 length:795 start_codon:yes stop_codon:yes gene_type:complete